VSRPPKTSKVIRRRPNRFRERELRRIMSAVHSSGVPVKEITVDPTTGKYTVVIGDIAEVQATGEEAAGTKAWGEAIAKLQKGKTAAQPKSQ
jgi:hypothetical protein